MSRIERGIPSEIDLSIDPAVIEQANNLLRAKPNIERSKEWLQSPEKRRKEKCLAALILACFSPALIVSCLSVLAADGRPVFYKDVLAFPGPNEKLIRPTEILKVRTLKRDIHRQERDPFSTTVFRGGRQKKPESTDPRVHSVVGRILRKTSLDEIPQLISVIVGEKALIGPRGYTPREIKGLHILLGEIKQMEELKDYQEIMAAVAPRPGIASLYAAICKKDLTPPERLTLNKLYCLCATPEGDNRIFLASLLTTLKMTGAR